MLNTLHRRREYKDANDKRVAKFMPRYNGCYHVKDAWPSKSVYELEIPNHPLRYAKFHSSELRPYNKNDDVLFPNRARPTQPPPVVAPDGTIEYEVDAIIDERRRGRSHQYLVSYRGQGPENDCWLPRADLEDCEALDCWEADNPPAQTIAFRRSARLRSRSEIPLFSFHLFFSFLSALLLFNQY
jgi:hypothetical protein